MRKFFAITLCLVLTASAVSAAPRQQVRREIKPATTAVAAAIQILQILRLRLGIVPNGDGLTPPIPRPNTTKTCCK
jgi:hypothetical protein